MRVPGVTAHFSRIHIRDQNLSSDDAFERLLDQIREEIGYAIDRVMTCEPDYMVMGMSAETFWDGMEGNRAFVQRVSERTGKNLQVATGAEACERALKLFGVKKIGVVTPYQPIGDKNVIRFFNDIGFEVTALKGLKCPTAVAIAHVSQDELRDALMEVNVPGTEALVQVGTNLSMVSLAEEAERWLKKPVIAINAATWWMALRDNGIHDKVYGAGRLLREF
jgi:maleate isomerase